MEVLLNSITPALVELSSDKNWRIRKQNIENLVYFAQQIVFTIFMFFYFNQTIFIIYRDPKFLMKKLIKSLFLA